MKSPVAIARSVALNRETVLPLLRTRLEMLEEASERGTVMLAARTPGDGRIAVAVRVSVRYPPPKAPRFGLTIAARSTPRLFPQFRGELTLEEAGVAATVVTLSGHYEVPLGVLGRAFDATAARGVAPRGLEDLLARLIADTVGDAARQPDSA